MNGIMAQNRFNVARGKPLIQPCPFKVGDLVAAIAFTNCFGDLVPTQRRLTVTSVKLIEAECGNYYRVDATRCDPALTELGHARIEGAARFFLHDHVIDA